MFSTTLIALLASTGLASPTLKPRNTIGDSGTFLVVALTADSNAVDGQYVNANNLGLCVNCTTASSCPTTGVECPVGNVTAFKALGDGNLWMASNVSPAQQVFVGGSGQLGFTLNSALPAAAETGNFTYTASSTSLTFGPVVDDDGYYGIIACPAGDGSFSVAATVPGFTENLECVPMVMYAVPYEGSGAYQYN